MEQFYTVEEVASALKVTRQTVYRWMQSGALRYVMAGERRRITKAALDDFLKEGRTEDVEENTPGEQPENKYRPILIAA